MADDLLGVWENASPDSPECNEAFEFSLASFQSSAAFHVALDSLPLSWND